MNAAWQGDAPEVGVITFQGKEFSANGALISDELVVGYIVEREGKFFLTAWDGSCMFVQLTRTSTWKTPRSFISSTMCSWTTTINGRRFNGRSAGDGMLIQLKRSGSKS